MLPKCASCKKEEAAMKTWLERLRYRLFGLFHTDITDLSADKFTEGFGEGYAKGVKHAREMNEKERGIVDALDGLKRSWERQVAVESGVQAEQVLQISERSGKRVALLGDEVLTKEMLIQLKGEKDLLQRMKIWSIMQETVKEKAIEKAILNSTNFEQVLAGKMMLHNLGILRSIMDVIGTLKE